MASKLYNTFDLIKANKKDMFVLSFGFCYGKDTVPFEIRDSNVTGGIVRMIIRNVLALVESGRV
jgi:hypothetical protein